MTAPLALHDLRAAYAYARARWESTTHADASARWYDYTVNVHPARQALLGAITHYLSTLKTST